MNFHPEAVGRAPGRVNLIGEHTDYNSGLCLPLALPRAATAAVAPRPDGSLEVRSASFPGSWQGTIEGLAPGTASGWEGYVTGVLWAMRQGGLDVPGLEIRIDSDVPIGAGLSSSAALECAVAVAVAGLLDLPLTDRVRERLADCFRVEVHEHSLGSRGSGYWTGALPRRCGPAPRPHLRRRLHGATAVVRGQQVRRRPGDL